MTTTRQEVRDDRTLIETLLESYSAALSASDAESAMSLYGADPVFMPPNSPPLIGREAVGGAFDQASQSNRRLKPRFTVQEIETAGNLAWARVGSVVRIQNLATGNETEAGSSQLYLLRREKGVWKIHCYMFNRIAQ